ncbi:hypothetical protein [Leuconostoc mesenteroides]|uniref:hypothetical protein n=1 Tax=Leuconostoc mesenteroides TaxID=1245 RepID=UPI001362AE93|nr:hypothetical protein [Leuconostoc mesenteroides]QHM55692.1 hypothetical protein C7M43_00394 [Leuconostoc mesenteroides]
MAERRMFSKRIISSARFIQMPPSTQALYFHLGLNADDDGVVEAFTVMRLIGASEDELRILSSKGLVTVLNNELVTYLNDWRENNKIRPDRKVNSIYKDLLIKMVPDAELVEQKPRADTGKITGKGLDVQRTTNGPLRLGKDRVVEDRLGQESLVQNSTGKLKENEQSTETPAQQMLNIFNKALGRNVANQGTFSGLVFKNVSVQEFEDVINYVMSWNDDILQNTTASTIARNFDKYSDKASELGYRDGKKPIKKTSNKGYGNKAQRVEPQMITEPVAESNVDVSDVAKELAELEDMGIPTKLEE